MHTKQTLQQDLERMGMQPTDTLFVHASMKAIGEVDGGADTVLDAFMEYMKDGLLVFPTHTWASMSEKHRCYDPKVEPSCVGLLTNMFMKREGVLRSLHPTHSVAAYGEDAVSYIEGEQTRRTPCAPEGVYGRLKKRKAKILLLGVTHGRHTYMHCVEEMLKVPNRFTKQPVSFQIVLPDGRIREQEVYRHYNATTAHISETYDKLAQGFEERQVVKQVSFGDASCLLCDAVGVYNVMKQVLAHESDCFMERETIPPEWWR